MRHDPGSQGLGRTLRAAAARVSERAGDGVALIYGAAAPDAMPPLRAAAGFESPEAARRTAEALAPEARAALASRQPLRMEASDALGARGAGGLLAVPLRVDDRLHGALLCASPEPLTPSAEREVQRLAEQLALRIDHDRLRRELAALRDRAEDARQSAHAREDEILHLSEALFAQDVELLRTHAELGRVEQLKHDFIEKMSRELRTPLNGIIEAIIAVLAGENESLSAAARGSLRRALDDGTAFLRTLQNILDLWRIKQGELAVECQDVSLPEAIDEAIFSVQDTLGGKPVTIEKRIEEPFPKLRSDLAKLSHLLLLLLDNAAKFTSEGCIEIHARVEDDQLVCSVKDPGIGIAPDDQQHVFEEFFQVDPVDHSVYRGAGLGLTLARDLVALLDGEIALRSDIGAGTTVTFRIPVQVR